MIQSHFQYCISSWCFNNKALIHRLQNTTNKVIRLAFNAKKEDDITAVMKKHNIMIIEQTAQLEIVKFMHKYFNNMLPDAFNNFFQHNYRNCNIGRSRSKATIFPKFCRIKLTQQLFKYKGPVQWNKLPPALKRNKIFEIFYQPIKAVFLSFHEHLIHLKFTSR